jgi:hypothetical protein
MRLESVSSEWLSQTNSLRDRVRSLRRYDCSDAATCKKGLLSKENYMSFRRTVIY